jgi:hypothetical protein
METIVTDKVKIDSLNLMIDKDKVNFYGYDKYNGEICGGTGEIEVKEKKKRKGKIIENGITLLYKEVNFFDKPRVMIALNSKHLGLDYFSGLNESTIGIAYDTIMRMGNDIFFIDKNNFINDSTVNDLDICQDIFLETKPLINTFKQIVTDRTREKWMLQPERASISSDRNLIECQERENSKLIRPHFKIYSKTNDMIERSSDFFLSQGFEPILDLTRFETCLFTARQIKSVTGGTNKLKDVLRFDFSDRMGKVLDSYGVLDAMGILKESKVEKPDNTDYQLHRAYVYMFFNQYIITKQNRGNLRPFKTAKDIQLLMEKFYSNGDYSSAMKKKISRRKTMFRNASIELSNMITNHSKINQDSFIKN